MLSPGCAHGLFGHMEGSRCTEWEYTLRRRYIPKLPAERPVQPFQTAEEAWFWFSRCQRVRADGARLKGAAGATARPCDPDDVYRAVVSLFRHGRLHRNHLVILATFGLRNRPPDPRCAQETTAARFWDEALDRLTTVLKSKGIVE